MAQTISLPPKPPKRYWQDSDWAVKNIQLLTKKFPNEWVAIFEKQVVVHNTDLDRVLSFTEAQNILSPVVKYIERGIHVYQNFTSSMTTQSLLSSDTKMG